MPPSSSEFVDLARAVAALQRGEFILVYDGDGREEETDLTIASEFVTPESIRTLRKEAGGLICATLSGEVRARIGLPFIAGVLRPSGSQVPVLQVISKEVLKYRRHRSLSISVNPRHPLTGRTEAGRASPVS